MKQLQVVFYWVGFYVLSAATVWSGDITLVDNGKSDYVIVLSPNASPSEKFAAEELSLHVKQMSGAVLNVQNDGLLSPHSIVLGFGSASEKLGVKVDKSLGEEGYCIKTIGSSLVIAGGQLRGTLYGVYTFLEKMGVRWWTPTETFIPELKTIKVAESDIREVPKLEYRDMMFREAMSSKLWMARNKLNGMSWELGSNPERFGGRYEWVGTHFLHGCTELLLNSGVPIRDEMWSMVNGKRVPNSQPCFTNPDVVNAVAASVIRELKAHPEAKFIACGHAEQGFQYCHCEKCEALAAKEGPSGLYIAFINQVAAIVAKEIPDGCVGASCYGWATNPPKTIKPLDNVVVTYDPISCDYMHPLASKHDEQVDIENDYQLAQHYYYRGGDNKRIRRDIDGWSKICKKLILYDYTSDLDHPIAPYPDLDSLSSNIRYYADHGFSGIFLLGSLSSGGGEFFGLRMWVQAKSLWNPELDGEALISEFLKGYYGPAAPAIKKYIDIMHQVPRGNKDFYMAEMGSLLNSLHLKPENIADAEVALQEAERLVVGNTEFENRVHHARLPICYILAKRGPGSVTWKAVEDKIGKKISLQDLAKTFDQVRAYYKLRNRPDYEIGPPFTDWLNDYEKLVSDDKGRGIPLELAAVDEKKYRLIHVCQMDARAGCWKKTEGASDGWCAVLDKPTFGIEKGLMAGEDYVAGKKYKIFMRIKGQNKKKDGDACYAGVYGDIGKSFSDRIEAWKMSTGMSQEEAKKSGCINKKIMSDVLADGQFHVIEVAETVNPAKFEFNMAWGDASMEKVYLDCFWLQEAD